MKYLIALILISIQGHAGDDLSAFLRTSEGSYRLVRNVSGRCSQTLEVRRGENTYDQLRLDSNQHALEIGHINTGMISESEVGMAVQKTKTTFSDDSIHSASQNCFLTCRPVVDIQVQQRRNLRAINLKYYADECLYNKI